MKRGPKTTPTALKRLQGTDRPDRMNPNEPLALLVDEVPAAPSWLNKWAKEEWIVAAGWLKTVNLLATTDVSIVAAYCQQMGVFREAEEMLKKPGSRVIVTDKGYEMPSPWVAIGNKALMQALKIAAEYGLTPSARTKISIPVEEEEDEFEKLLNMKS